MSGVSPTALAEHGFVRGFSEQHIARLAGAATLVTVEPGHRFFEEGGHANRLWLIRTGHVAMDLHVPGPRGLIVETIGSDEVIGLSCMSPPFQWQFGAEALLPTTAFQLDAIAVLEMCEADPALGYQLARGLMAVAAHRLHATRVRLLDLYASSHPPVSRP
jgi:CRP/FNR family transcriptional regulator, cyclic AMP receptor protein